MSHVYSGRLARTANTMRDRSVPTMTVPCPTCGASTGERCFNTDGVRIKSTNHTSRRRMAVRAQNAQMESFDVTAVQYARRLALSERKARRTLAGLSRRQLAELIDVSESSLTNWESYQSPTGPAGARYGAWLQEQA